jgi:hypothetical protein
MLPAAFLLAILIIYAKGEISGAKLESLLRRLLIAVALFVAFPEISSYATGLETYLVNAFGGETALTQVFSQVADRAKEIGDAGSINWLRIGQIGLTLISTLSFLILAVVRHFLDVLHLTTWNLLNIVGPISLVGCLFDSWQQVPKGIFIGMLELSLWKPIWVILARILIAIGFGETPADPSQWFDTAVMNFAVAGLMASTPMIAHGILSGTLASVGSGVLQAALSGTGAMLAAAPMRALTRGASEVKKRTTGAIGRAASSSTRLIKTQLGMPPDKGANGRPSGKNNNPPQTPKGK